MIFLLRDDFDGSEELARLKAQFADPSARELNTTVLDGRSLDLGELIRACEAPPFLADKRLVIVRRLLARFQPKNARRGGRKAPPRDDVPERNPDSYSLMEVSGQGPDSYSLIEVSGQGSDAHSPREISGQDSRDASGKSSRDDALVSSLCSLLEHVPEYTDLVFIEDTNITNANPVYRAIDKAGGRIVQRVKPLKGQDLVEWIVQRTRKKGARIASDAAQQLAAFGSEDLRTMDNDLEKLAVYAGAREITSEDVRALVTDAREANIFAFVDAVGEGNAKTALTVLHGLLFDGAPAAYLLTMIVRQFRLLLQVRELGGSATSPDEVASRLGVHRFVAQKLMQQARRFSLERLEGAYRSLVETDMAIKTGQMDAEAALDLLVVELALRRG